MDLFGLLSMIGGLALFLYGMKVMGDALSKLAGGKLEQVLEKMTSNRIMAVLLGAGVTAVIQSSSATTVMVVGFVNSGIMKLSQAIGVIMGANIGTTITSWLFSLTGIESSNFFVKLLKPASFSPILALIGIVLILFIKDSKKKDIGSILLGFAVLMFGMNMMSDAVKPLADVPKFTALFTAFKNPFLGMIVGAVLTAIIQSSSASVGILQVMCNTGSVSLGAAIPVIMGQNIGTCITAIISGMGASKNAKRAALMHLYFNLIGTILFMVIFYSINAFVSFHFLSDTANAASIAVIHSIFNIAATIVLFPASKLIEKLVYLTIPKTDNEEADKKVQLLDERFLEHPAFAVAQCKSAVCNIAQLVQEAMELCCIATENYDEKAITRIVDIENDIDIKEDELSTYLSKLSAKPLTERDSVLVSMFGKSVIDFERMSDYLKGISFTLRQLHQDKEKFSKKAAAEAKLIMSASLEIVENTVQCFIHDDYENAFKIDPLADVISRRKKDTRENHNKRLAKGKCSVELGMALTDIVNSLERIAKHCSNIAEEEISLDSDRHALHQYARNLKEGNENYEELIQHYLVKYAFIHESAPSDEKIQ